jgi:hypothetical protein
MALRNDTEVALEWGKMPTQICAMLPWEVELKAHVVKDGKEAAETAPLNCIVSVRALKAVVALEENFADCKLGKWHVRLRQLCPSPLTRRPRRANTFPRRARHHSIRGSCPAPRASRRTVRARAHLAHATCPTHAHYPAPLAPAGR